MNGLFCTEDKASLIIQAVLCDVFVMIVTMIESPAWTSVGPCTNELVGPK